MEREKSFTHCFTSQMPAMVRAELIHSQELPSLHVGAESQVFGQTFALFQTTSGKLSQKWSSWDRIQHPYTLRSHGSARNRVEYLHIFRDSWTESPVNLESSCSIRSSITFECSLFSEDFCSVNTGLQRAGFLGHKLFLLELLGLAT